MPWRPYSDGLKRVKVRRGGVGTHLCLHKHFYDTSPRWREVREEESKAQQLFHGAPEPDDAGEIAEDAAPQTLADLGFTSIDARHMSSLPLIQGRVMKLLKASHNHIHAANNMLLKIVSPFGNGWLVAISKF